MNALAVDPAARAALTRLETSLFSTPARPAPTSPATPATPATSVSVRAAYQLLLFRRAVLVDIRPEGQRRAEGEVHPALGPVLVERDALEWRLDPRSAGRLGWASPEVRVLVLCQEGYASSFAAAGLVRLGVRAAGVTGGLRAWREAGLPLAV